MNNSTYYISLLFVIIEEIYQRVIFKMYKLIFMIEYNFCTHLKEENAKHIISCTIKK